MLVREPDSSSSTARDEHLQLLDAQRAAGVAEHRGKAGGLHKASVCRPQALQSWLDVQASRQSPFGLSLSEHCSTVAVHHPGAALLTLLGFLDRE